MASWIGKMSREENAANFFSFIIAFNSAGSRRSFEWKSTVGYNDSPPAVNAVLKVRQGIIVFNFKWYKNETNQQPTTLLTSLVILS